MARTQVLLPLGQIFLGNIILPLCTLERRNLNQRRAMKETEENSLRKYEVLFFLLVHILQHPWVQVSTRHFGSKDLEAGTLAKVRQNSSCVRGKGVLHRGHCERNRRVRLLERQDWVSPVLS